ncbi:MAG: diaminopimelate epimerase [Phycisphaerales bacterium]
MLPFVKMHGIGNDYVYLDAVGDPSLATRRDLPKLAREMSDRHTGIGSDGLILVCQPTADGAKAGAHVRMRMFNADGSESEMCGNGIRCVAKFAHDRLGFTASPMLVETGDAKSPSGIHVRPITLTLGEDGRVETATVDMGEPDFDLHAAGLRGLEAKANTPRKPVPVVLDDHRYEAVMVGTGNPHAVFFLEPDGNGPNDVGSSPKSPPTAVRSGLGPKSLGPNGTEVLELVSIDLKTWGPRFEHHAMFRDRTNVHFASVKGKKTVHMRTWERGSGITQACGTGACAVVAAGVVTDRLSRDVKVALPGGDLSVRWDEATNHLFMTGPAVEICSGQWPTDDPPAIAAIPALTTERLILRPMTPADAKAVATLAGDKRISDMTLTVPHPYKPEQAVAWISTHRLSHSASINTVWAMTDKTTGELVGTMGLVYNRHNGAEVGYWTGVPFWGKGYATESLAAVLAYAFEQRTPPLQRVDAHHFFGNDASGKVMQNAGMVSEGQCLSAARKHGEPLNVMRYAITREQWLAHQPAPASRAGVRK